MQSVIDDFVRLAKLHGRMTAIDQGTTRVSYAELLDRAACIAEQLSAIGVRPKDVIAICGTPSCGLYASILGVLLARSVLLSIDPRLPLERIRLMMEESGSRLIIRLRGTQAELPALETVEVDPASASILTVREGDPAVRFDSSACHKYEFPAYLFATSGTTGQARLVTGCHMGLAHFIQWQRKTFQVGSGDRIGQLTGLSFDVVLRDIFLPLTSGATLCAPDTNRLAPSAVFPWLQAARITRLHAVPTVAQSWLNLGPAGANLPLLRTVFFAGEPLTDVLVARWRRRLSSQCEIVNLYGPTETTLAKFFFRVPTTAVKKGIQPVGAPLPGCELYILDENLQECVQGVTGQIAIATEYRSYGYLNAPEESARRFLVLPLKSGQGTTVFLTGDLGKISPSGQLHILGRIDNQVKINGIRVELEEISAVAARHPGVASAVTVMVEAGGSRTKQLCLYWTPNRSAIPPSIGGLRQFLARHLPEGVIPSIMVRLKSLPVTPNGKVDRSLLPAPKVFSAELVPKTRAEKQLLPIWERVLKDSGGAPGADFFSSGGTSLLVVELQSRIEETLGISISAADVFKKPRFQAIARLIAQASGSRRLIPRAPVREEYPLLASQRAHLHFHYGEENRAWNNVSTIVPFNSRVSAETMRQALTLLVERHQNLRLTFHRQKGGWIQKLNQGGPIALREIDLRHLPSPEQQLVLAQVQKQQSKTILPPDKWPMFLSTLAHMNESDTRLLFTSSHLVSDAVSHDIIATELNESVYCLQQGMDASLPKFETDFLDYVVWRLGQPQLNPRRDSLDYWLEVFSDYRERLELPLDGDPAEGGSAAGYKKWIPEALSRQVRHLSAELNCSNFVVLFSAFAISLHLLSGRNVIVLKTVADGRSHSFLRKWVGNFATVVHVRSEIRDGTTFLTFIREIQRGISRAVKHQECVFIEVLEALGIPVETDRIPLASIFLNPVGKRSAMTPASHEEYCDDLGQELKADIMAYLRAVEPLIEIDVHYRKGLYSRQTISRLMNCFEKMLKDVTAAPANRIAVPSEAVA